MYSICLRIFGPDRRLKADQPAHLQICPNGMFGWTLEGADRGMEGVQPPKGGTGTHAPIQLDDSVLLIKDSERQVTTGNRTFAFVKPMADKGPTQS